MTVLARDIVETERTFLDGKIELHCGDCFAILPTLAENSIDACVTYQDDIRRRMALVLAGPDERAREAVKAKLKDKPPDHGPLFAEAAE